MRLSNMLGVEAAPHSLLKALQQMNPKAWGKLPVYRPPFTRKIVNGRDTSVENTAEIAEAVAESLPVTENYSVLDTLERVVRRMPRSFVETDVPEDLRCELKTMVRLGILSCVSRRRADVKQYIRVGV